MPIIAWTSILHVHFNRCLSSQKINLLNNAIFVGVILLVVSSLVQGSSGLSSLSYVGM